MLFGGAFDPPHTGHVALFDAACARFRPDRVHLFVVAAPGHKQAHAAADARLQLARAAFPDEEVALDDHAYTVDMLRDREDRPLFVIGADEWRDFATWKEPDEVLRLARVAVGSRSGVDDLRRDERVTFFELDSPPVSSREIRRRVASGEGIDGLVPDAVRERIRDLNLYADYTSSTPEQDVSTR